MNRRTFLGSLVTGALSLVGLGRLVPRDPFADHQWHRLAIVDGVTTVDGKPWQDPWFKAWFNEQEQLTILVNGPNRTVNFGFFKAAQCKDTGRFWFESEMQVVAGDGGWTMSQIPPSQRSGRKIWDSTEVTKMPELKWPDLNFEDFGPFPGKVEIL